MAQKVLLVDEHSALRTRQRRNAVDGILACRGEIRHLSEQSLDQAVEEFVSAPDVPVDRRDRHTELVGEPTHRECLHPIEIDQPGRGLEDLSRR